MKKIMVILTASLLLLLSACSSGSNKTDSGNADATATQSPAKETSAAAKQQEVTIWAWDPKFNIASLKIAEDLYKKQEQNPVAKLNIVEYAQDDIIKKLNVGLSSGTSEGLPNIVLIEDYRAQSFLQAYPDMFYDLSSYIKPGDFAEYKIGPTSLDGKQYGVPFDSGVTGLYVRTDYLQQAGYTVDDMKNIDWNKYIEIGKKVKEKTGKDMLTLDPNDLGILRVMIQTAGSWYMKADGKTPDLGNNQALKQAFTIFKQMMDANIVKVNSDWSSFVAAFNSGDVATVPTGNWITPSVKAAKDQSGKWAVVPIPKLPDNPDSVNYSNLGGSSWYVLNIPGKEAAADFMAKTFGSNADMYQKLLTDVGALGTYKPAASGPAYDTKDPFFGGQNIIADFADWTAKIPRVNYGMHTYAIDDILKVEMQNYLNGKVLDKALADAQAQAEAQIK